ncbi:MAG: CPBP family intramembrane metalloprotease [Phycisphaerae bacterium]|nr:CPBP family intramembrane metalloprotease [Phycisphaerae bacterium]
MLVTRRTTSWVVIIVVVASTYLMTCFLRFPEPVKQAVTALFEGTGGLFSTKLPRSWLTIAVVGGIMAWAGGLRARDVGLRWAGVVPALLFAIAIWGTLQVCLLLTAISDGGPITLHPSWSAGWRHQVGDALGNTWGVALYEEIVFRGFLLTQLTLKLTERLRRPRLALALALVIAQALFALAHIHAYIRHDVPLWDMPLPLGTSFFFGLLFAFVFLLSGNLLFAVVTHGLLNVPLPMIDAFFPDWFSIPLIAAGWMTVAWLVGRRQRGKDPQHL